MANIMQMNIPCMWYRGVDKIYPHVLLASHHAFLYNKSYNKYKREPWSNINTKDIR